MSKLNRRSFLITGAMGIAACGFSPALLKGNEEIVRLGVLGLGNRWNELNPNIVKIPNLKIMTLYDPDSARLAAALKKNPGVKGATDPREIFDSNEIDAVLVTTCNHWHALAAVWAMQAGKHVYVEKPLALTFWEGQQIVKAAKKYNRICQIGHQMRTDPVFHREVKEFLHKDKALGEIKSVRINRFAARPSIGKRTTPLTPPSTVNYNLWLGPSADLPLYRERFHYDWHFMWNTGNGETGNWGSHLIDDCRNDILCDKIRIPKRILAGGGRVGYNDVGETPNSMFVYFDTGAIPIVFCISNLADKQNRRSTGTCPGPGSGYVAFCEGGRYEKQWGSSVAYDQEGKVIRKFTGTGLIEGGRPHFQNFVNAILQHDSSLLNGPVQVGYDASVWYNGANAAWRLGEPYSKEKALAIPGTDNQLARAISDLETHLNKQGIPMNADTFKMSRFLDMDDQNDKVIGEYASDVEALFSLKYRKPFVVPEIL